MAMKIENISDGKIIGIGNVTVLPGETKEIPVGFETSPVLEVYRKCKMAKITGRPSSQEPAPENPALTKSEYEIIRNAELFGINEEEYEDKKEVVELVLAEMGKIAEEKAAGNKEELRKARLASLEGINEEDLGKLANDLGINPANCKDQADVLKKVKAALKQER